MPLTVAGGFDAVRCGAVRCDARGVALRTDGSKMKFAMHVTKPLGATDQKSSTVYGLQNTDTGRKNVKGQFPMQNCDKSPVKVSSRVDSGTWTWTQNSGRDLFVMGFAVPTCCLFPGFAHRPPALSGPAPPGRPKSRRLCIRP